MNTKFILHGGFEKGKKQQNDLFFQEMLKDTGSGVKILLVYFAEPDEKVQQRTESDIEEFNKNKGGKNITFKVATEQNFEEECKWADVVYLHGGKTVKIMESLRTYPNISSFLTGRTIAGDSAGANSLCKLFFSRNSKTIGNGLGILPLKVVPHYEGGLNPLQDVEPQLETVLLKEFEMKVIWDS